MRTRSEISAGGVVYRRSDEGVEVVLAARRTRRGDLAWGLPKGLVEPDETPEQAAVREVREETSPLLPDLRTRSRRWAEALDPDEAAELAREGEVEELRGRLRARLLDGADAT